MVAAKVGGKEKLEKAYQGSTAWRLQLHDGSCLLYHFLLVLVGNQGVQQGDTVGEKQEYIFFPGFHLPAKIQGVMRKGKIYFEFNQIQVKKLKWEKEPGRKIEKSCLLLLASENSVAEGINKISK